MTPNFEKYAAKGNDLVHLIAEDLKVPKDKAGRILRAVLHTLRNQLSHEESFQLLAQLPMALKGVYVDGWKYDTNFHRIHHVKDFLEEVRKQDKSLAAYDFGNDAKAKLSVAAVFKALNHLVSKGEMDDIIAVMPLPVKEFISENLVGRKIVM